jgi:hypothetical protein
MPDKPKEITKEDIKAELGVVTAEDIKMLIELCDSMGMDIIDHDQIKGDNKMTQSDLFEDGTLAEAKKPVVNHRAGAVLSLGQMVITRGIAFDVEEDENFRQFVQSCLARHSRGDWGDLTDEDRKLNDEAVKSGQSRILSSYLANFPVMESDTKIWIITEWDRSVTTILYPSEY